MDWIDATRRRVMYLTVCTASNNHRRKHSASPFRTSLSWSLSNPVFKVHSSGQTCLDLQSASPSKSRDLWDDTYVSSVHPYLLDDVRLPCEKPGTGGVLCSDDKETVLSSFESHAAKSGNLEPTILCLPPLIATTLPPFGRPM